MRPELLARAAGQQFPYGAVWHPTKTLRQFQGETNMGLIDKLRKAEEQGRGAAHRGFERARENWDDAERRLRRKMRLHPHCIHESAPLPMTDSPPELNSEPADATLQHHASKKTAA
jgi:hypothetical protein